MSWRHTNVDLLSQRLEVQDWNRDDGRARDEELCATIRMMLKLIRDELTENKHGAMQWT